MARFQLCLVYLVEITLICEICSVIFLKTNKLLFKDPVTLQTKI